MSLNILPNKANQNNSFWKSTWESILRREAEIAEYKEFLAFMQAEYAKSMAEPQTEAELMEARN